MAMKKSHFKKVVKPVVKPVAKKIGRPSGSKNKIHLFELSPMLPMPDLKKENRLLVAKQAAKANKEAFKQSINQQLEKLKTENVQLMAKNLELTNCVRKLDYQIIGFRAVLSYLEKQFSLKQTQ